MSVKFIQLNIEGDKHLDAITDLFAREHPEVLCLQEISLVTFEHFKNMLGMNGHWAPMTSTNSHGVGLLTNLPIVVSNDQYYWLSKETLLSQVRYTDAEDLEWLGRVLVSMTVEKDGKQFIFLGTHFPKNHEGYIISDFQRNNYQSLLKILEQYPECILAGDTNCPRGTEIFDDLAKCYTDNIPQDAITTLDRNLHRKGKELSFVVDGLFTTPVFTANNVRLVDGVSDHMAVVADIF